MKILHVIDSLGPGGAERVLAILLPALARRGHHVEVAALMPPYDLAATLERAGIRVHRIGAHNRWDVLSSLAGIRSIARAGRVEVLHGHLFFGALYVALVPVPRDVVKVATYHNLGYDVEPAVGAKLRLRKALHGVVARRLLDAHTAVSQSAAASYGRHLGLSAIECIANPVSEAAIEAARRQDPAATRSRLGLTADTSVAMIVGRLSSEKGHSVAFDVIATLKRRGREVTLLVVGDGPLKHQLVREVSDRALEGNVRFLGTMENEELLRDMAAADIVLAPSKHEGMPMAVLEAMAIGTPLVVSDIAPMRELIRDGATGLVAAGADVQALADSVERVLTDRAMGRTLGEAARADALARFGDESIATEWETYYAGLRSKHR